MDHLPLPRSSTTRLPRVPYICEIPYDNGDFKTYPLRAGLPFVAQPTADLSWLQREHLQPSESSLLEPFLQSWIFFGLLHHLLAPAQLYSADDYLTSEDGKLYLQTTILEDRLSAWLDFARALGSVRKKQVLADLEQCLRLANAAFQILELPGHVGFDRTLRLCLGALFETIGATARLIDPDMDGFGISLEIDEAMTTHMLRNGWCPAEIAAATDDHLNVSGRIYLEHMYKPGMSVEHSSCTSEGCAHSQIDLVTYQPRHVTETCNCRHQGPPPGDIMACLEAGSFPLLDIDSLDDMAVHSRRPEMPYVAISHVWADGLGNPHDMSLPRCQLSKLKGYVEGIRCKTFQYGDDAEEPGLTELHLWCDSLCCPTRQPGKAASLAKLADVYRHSTYVLVVDSTLEYFNFFEIDHLEAVMRLLTSKWNRRLWTYQEAGLTRKVLIQFADGPVDLRDIWDHVRNDYLTRIAGRYLYRDAAGGCSTLRSLFSQGPNLLTGSVEGIDFAMALRGLAYRRVSIATDEPLCVAAVFDLDTGAVSHAEPSSRMEIVWSLLSRTERGLPEFIIFSNFPRMTSVGFRWAPATLQQSVSKLPFTINADERHRKSIVTARGLRVSRPGWRITLPGPPSNLPDGFSPATEPQRALGRVRDPHGKWFNIVVTKYLLEDTQPSVLELLQDGQKDWHLLLESNHDEAPLSQRRALLGYVERHESGLMTFRSVMLVWVARQATQYDPYWEGVYPYATALRQSLPVRMFAICCKFEALLRKVFAWFPNLLRRPIVVVLNKLFQLIGKTIVRRIVERIQKAAVLASRVPEIAALLKRVDQSESSPTDLVAETKAFLMTIFMGRVATISHVFGVKHGWYVD